MNALVRAGFAIVLVAGSGFIGWRVIEAYASPWPPSDEADDTREASTRLEAYMLDGDAFGDLAVAAQSDPDRDRVRMLHELAVRRDPRDMRIRLWLAEQALASGAYAEGLDHLDVMLHLGSSDLVHPLLGEMAKWTADPAFAEALAVKLAEDPVWRGHMVAKLRQGMSDPGPSAVLGHLQASGTLDSTEFRHWLDALISAGQYGLAYAHWVASLDLAPGQSLPMLWNGDFERPATGVGFDWRIGGATGSYTQLEPTAGTDGRAARLVFLGRRVERADLAQAMALVPGAYLLSWRAKGAALRSDQGLQWTVTCGAGGRPIAASVALQGSFSWTPGKLRFQVPANCPGQWLHLSNPAPRGSAQIVSGELWVDDLTIRPVAGSPPDGV